MAKRKADQPNSPPSDRAGSEPAKLEAQTAEAGPPAEQLAKIAAPDPAPAASSAAAPAEAPSATPLPPPAPFIVIDAPNIEAASSAPPIAPPEPARPEMAAPSEAAAPAEPTFRPWAKMPRVRSVAAGLAIAAVVGAMAGSAATAGLGGLWASPPPSAKTADKSADKTADKTADVRPLRETIARLNTELAALKASIENSGRTANAQFSKLGDRLDRVEHAQAEPAAKLAKLAEAVDRMEHRAPASASTSHDVTGSIAAPLPQPATALPARPAGPPILDGWIVRSVYNGTALIQARYGGVIEVEPGDSLPGLGRIENIRRQDGRWVVVTSRGMIVAR